MLALVHSTGQQEESLEAQAHRRLLALLTVAWEHNRRLSLRLVDFADTFRQRGLLEVTVQLQVLAGLARVRASELRLLLKRRGCLLLPRLPHGEASAGAATELARIAQLGATYGFALDIAVNLERDLELAEELHNHVEELADLVRQLAAYLP